MDATNDVQSLRQNPKSLTKICSGTSSSKQEVKKAKRKVIEGNKLNPEIVHVWDKQKSVFFFRVHWSSAKKYTRLFTQQEKV